jgi:PST family polysaccharide transporter
MGQLGRVPLPSLFDLSTERLRHEAQRAGTLGLLTRGIDVFFQTVALIILARLLTPAEFGVFAMVTPFVWIVMHVGDLGLGAALTQQTSLNSEEASGVFFVNMAAGFCFAFGFLVCSPLIGAFYRDPRAGELASVLSVLFLIAGFTGVHVALLRRALRFEVLLYAQLIASAVSASVAVVLALKGAGYWALAARAIVDPLVYSISVWSSGCWFPVRPSWGETTRSLLRVGRFSMGYALMLVAGRQADQVLIGWRYGSAELGPYSLASRLFSLPVQLLSLPIGNVVIPTLSRLRSEPERLKTWYTMILKALTLVAFPLFAILTTCAEDVVRLFAGPQWSQSVSILVLLGPVGALQIAAITGDWLMYSQGQANRVFRWACISTAVYIIAFVLGLPFGRRGVAAGFLIANILLFIPGLAYALRQTPIGLLDALRAMVPGVALAIASSAVSYEVLVALLPERPTVLRLAAVAVAVGALFAATVFGLYGRAVMLGISRMREAK